MPATATVRADLAAELTAALAGEPGVVVVDHGRSIDQVITRTVMVVLDTVEQGVPPRRYRAHTLSVWVIVPGTQPGAADTDLDALLDQVLDALDDSAVVTWTTAERSLYGDAQAHAYRIACTRQA